MAARLGSICASRSRLACQVRKSIHRSARRTVVLGSSRKPHTPENKGASDVSQEQLLVGAATGVLTFGVALALTVGRESIEDFVYNEALYGSGGFGTGDYAAAALWGVALWFCSPLQLLLLFLGKIETERPSDWALGILGRGLGLPVDAIDYSAPVWLRAVVAALCCAGGVGIAWASSSALGDATWGVSSGVGACFAAAVYEIGRPQRLSTEEAVALEQQWQDFEGWANERLQRGGQCHEAEIASAFQAALPRYRGAAAFSNDTLRSMVRNWYPDAKRSSSGYYKNLSLRPRSDPFTGQQQGTDLRAKRQTGAGGLGAGVAASGQAPPLPDAATARALEGGQLNVVGKSSSRVQVDGSSGSSSTADSSGRSRDGD